MRVIVTSVSRSVDPATCWLPSPRRYQNFCQEKFHVSPSTLDTMVKQTRGSAALGTMLESRSDSDGNMLQ